MAQNSVCCIDYGLSRFLGELSSCISRKSAHSQHLLNLQFQRLL